MEFTITTSLWVDINDIIKRFNLNTDTSDNAIKNAIYDYVNEMDDCDYYLVNDRILDEIFTEICNRIGR